jgi:hypothetical protein
MSVHSIDGNTFSRDVKQDRIAAGTIGDDHVTPNSLSSGSLSSIISTFDGRVANHGTWAWTAPAQLTDLLHSNIHSSTAASYLDITFTGTDITVIGQCGPNGGRMDTYIDGVLTNGQVNTYTAVSVQYRAIGGLDNSSTSIGVSSTSGFTASGTILIDKEEISYTSIGTATVNGNTVPAFLGCTRGANSTAAASHTAAVSVYAMNNVVEFYSAYYLTRKKIWSKNTLSPGSHVLRLVIRSDKSASSTDTYVEINGFVVGAMLGAPQILTSTNYTTIGPQTTDANGVIGPFVITPDGTDQQFLTFIGAYPIAGANWAFPMYDPTSNNWYFATNKGTTSVTLIATGLYLSAPL